MHYSYDSLFGYIYINLDLLNDEYNYSSNIIIVGIKRILIESVCRDIQCILGYPNLDYPNPNSQKFVNFHEFHYNLQDGGHLVIWSVFQPYYLYVTCFLHTNKVFMLVLMLEVQKDIMILVFRIISVIRTINLSEHLGTTSRPKGFW